MRAGSAGTAQQAEQASRCCTADVCLLQSVNQLNNNQRMAKLVLFFMLGHYISPGRPESPMNMSFSDSMNYKVNIAVFAIAIVDHSTAMFDSCDCC